MRHQPKRLQKPRLFSQERLHRFLSWVLVLAITAPMCGTGLVRASEVQEGTGLCPHHPEHTAECGYAPAREAVPCGHVHDEECGYVEGVDCGHVHDEACGYVEAVEEVPCGMDCVDEDGDGVIDHQEGCAYAPAVEGSPCSHVHDEECGYVEAVDCGHVHDEACGYQEASEGSPCGFVCEICAAEEAGEKTVTAWAWAGEDAPKWNEAAGCYGLGVPGASEELRLTADLLEMMLPGQAVLTLADGTEETVSLAWDLRAIPAAGVYEGSFTVSAELPEGYALAEEALPLRLLIEVGGGLYDEAIKKYINKWQFVAVDGTHIPMSNQYEIIITDNSSPAAIRRQFESHLPQYIWASGSRDKLEDGNFAPVKLKNAGFIVDIDTPRDGVWGRMPITWDLTNLPSELTFDQEYSVIASTKANPGYEIIVNDNTTADGKPDSSQNSNLLTLKVTIKFRDLRLSEHTVTAVDPADTTVNLFDYWVDTDGDKGNDLLKNPDYHWNGTRTQNVPRSGVDSWNKGINAGRLLLFGDGNIHAGFWNKGAGAGKKGDNSYGKSHAGMENIVAPVLTEGYPVINTAAMRNQLTDYALISDYELCGDPLNSCPGTQDSGAAHESTSPLQNISNTVIEKWSSSENKDNASLDYLFNPDISNTFKRSYENVKGLFQLDAQGYYYYDMRKNFAEYDKATNEFILYDAPAVDRTDKKYIGDDFSTDENDRSIGNFFPFNKGAQVFTGIEGDHLVSNETVQSHNGTNKSGTLMNHHLGMTVKIDFRQTPNGRINTSNGTVPMTFQFSGDDDVWVFIDDVLVLDLGGIHSEIFGTIDFSTGEVLVGQSWKTNGFPYNADGTVNMEELKKNVIGGATTLKALFVDALGEEEANKLNWSGDTFASDTGHTLKMFYLERGNYDSSLALRFNLQPRLYQQIRKVDQTGQPIGGVKFELYSATDQGVIAGEDDAIECRYTDKNVHGKEVFYVKQTGTDPLATLTTNADGVAQFENGQNEPFGFADQETQYFILKETDAPAGYRAMPEDIVLYYDRKTAMLSVANRWTTGAYACSVSNSKGTGQLNYGKFVPATENTEGDIIKDSKSVTPEVQENGLAIAVPMLRQSTGTWQALYGSNLGGFNTVVPTDTSVEAWRTAVLTAALRQAALDKSPQWYFSWDAEDHRLSGMLSDLPGLASRYKIYDKDGDMRMVYGMIEPAALAALGITEDTAEGRYNALHDYLQTHTVEDAVAAIQEVKVSGTPSEQGFSFLNTSQFNRSFRSLIYIPNEQRELWVMKVDQNGVPRNGAEFGLYSDESCQTLVASGKTAKVDGQDGLLIFSPRDDTSDGHAQIKWADKEQKHYYLKEISAPGDLLVNNTVIPVVVGTYSIYADAGDAGDGVSVMAGVGRLTQTMRQYAGENQVNITLRDITAFGQAQPSGNTEVEPEKWKDMALKDTSGNVVRSMNLHFGLNAAVDYGLHNEDGGTIYKPFFVADTGFVRARVQQNYDALSGNQYGQSDNNANDVNKENLGSIHLTNLFSLLNVVVVTDRAPEPPETGMLTIRKEVTGEKLTAADYTKNFTFKISLTDANDTPLTKSYYFWGTDKAGQIKDGDTFYLHHDEEITIQGLPMGTKFTVTETHADGWYTSPSSRKIEGNIQENVVSLAGFINSKQTIPEPSETGTLTITKTVTGTGGEKDKEFTFTVTFTGDNISPDGYPYRGSKSGTIQNGGTITLKHGESVTISGLPAGTGYTVTESGADGYSVTKSGETGTIAAGVPSIAAFTNYKDGPPPEVPKTGALTIRKTVTGSEGDHNQEFIFTVSFTGAGSTEEYSYSGSKSGTIQSGGTITLKHGQSVTISGLPAGTEYTVTESGADGYSVTKSGETGTIAAGVTASASFTNRKDGDSPGGGGNTPDPEDPKDPPKDPETPPKDPETPPKDPETPPVDPQTPPVDPPEPQTPPTDPETPPPGLPDPNDPNSPNEITIEEEGVPTTYVRVWDPENEEWIWLPEDEVPLFNRNIPKTGDSGHFGLWLLLGGAAAAGLGLLGTGKGRKKKDDQ